MLMNLAVISEWHIVLVCIILFLLFGGKKLPELAKGIGEAMKEFKKAQREVHDESPPSRPEPKREEPKQEVTTASAGSSKPIDPKLN